MRRDVIGDQFEGRRLGVAAVVVLVLSVVATQIIRVIAVNVVTVPSQFTPLKASSVASLTVLGVLAASASCALLQRRSDRPLATFRRVAPVVLVLSFIPDIGIWAAHAYGHTATGSTVIPLLIMHITVASLCIALLPMLGAERRTTVLAPGAGV